MLPVDSLEFINKGGEAVRHPGVARKLVLLDKVPATSAKNLTNGRGLEVGVHRSDPILPEEGLDITP